MEKYTSIRKAEKTIIKNFSKVLPVLILVTFIFLVRASFYLNFVGEAGILEKMILDFVAFPIIYIGITSFAVKLINKEKADISSVFEVLIKKPFQSYILSGCYVVITSIVLILGNVEGKKEAIFFYAVSAIVQGILTIKFVLAIYIFAQGYEKTAIASLERAWKESKGFFLELLKIYLTVAVAVYVLNIAGGVFTSIIIGLFPLPYDAITNVATVVSCIMAVLVVIFENVAFSHLAIDIFAKRQKDEGF